MKEETKLSMIFDIAYKMASLKRFSQTHLSKPESVLEHTGFVSLLCLYISLNLRKEGHSIDIGVVLCKAASHDIDEIVTGDIPRPTKYYNQGITEAIQKIEDKNMRKIAEIMETGEIYHYWKCSKEGLEGHIVALSDCLAIVYKAYYESIMLGNKTISDHVIGILPTLNSIEEKIQKNISRSSFLNEIMADAVRICSRVQNDH